MRNAFYRERETLKALSDWLMTYPAQLSMGPQCAEFERQFAAWQGRRYAVLFNSGASANLALLQSLRNMGTLQRTDRVGFSALTWSTNVMPIIQTGLTPVPVDIDAWTLQCDHKLIEEAGPMKAMFLTNALGSAAYLPRVRDWCEEQGIILLEDNCEALGTVLKDKVLKYDQEPRYRKAGSFGLAGTFSFYVAHHMSTIEGGMCATDDEELADMLRIVRANGWDRNLTADKQAKIRRQHHITSEFDAKYTFYDLAYNMRPTEITGFLGLEQLKYIDENINERERIFLEIEEAIRNNCDIHGFNHSHIKKLSAFCFPIVCSSSELRPKYMKRFAEAGVEVRPMIAGNMQRQPFYKKYVTMQRDLAATDMVQNNGFYFACYPELSQADIELLKSCLSGS